MELVDLLKALCGAQGSDLHLKVGRQPLARVHGDLLPLSQFPVIATQEEMTVILQPATTPMQWKRLESDMELDFSFEISGLARFRGNIFFQRGNLSAIFRMIPAAIPSLEELSLPEVLKELVARPQGLFLVTGPTGSGKTTTLAALVNYVNQNFPKHIITIEDPIEFSYVDAKASINQREVGHDTFDFAQALRRALRQDPDIILMGELRDAETISTALTAAETGHLVLGTLHTNDAKQSINRVLDTFTGDAQQQIRLQLASALVGVVSQRLIKRKSGGRVAAVEVLINTPMVRKLIEENKVGQMTKVMEDSASFYKMKTFNQALFDLVKNDIITADDAFAISENPNDLKILFQTSGVSHSSATASTPPGLR